MSVRGRDDNWVGGGMREQPSPAKLWFWPVVAREVTWMDS